jgi:hypothetical protein
MTTREELLLEIEQTPDPVLDEVLGFLRSTKARQAMQMSTDQGMPKDDRPIWEVADQIIAQIPPEAFNNLPTDGAAQIDHYLYDAPKQK